MAFNNSVQLNSAGAMPIIGYNKFGKLPRNAHYYVLGGATDYSRYLSADAATEARDCGFHRIYPGGHAGAPSWILDEAMPWLNGRYLADDKSKSALADARLDWEAAMIEWINGMKATEAHRAYYWARFLQDDCKISGPFRIRKRVCKRSLSQRDSVTKPGVGTTLGQRSPIFER